MYAKTYHATHPEMMAGASNEQLRERYRIGSLFVADIVQLNYTHVESTVQYLASTATNSNTTIVTTVIEDDLVNLSPNSYNATLYYDDGSFSARVSTSYRDGYLSDISTTPVSYKASVENVDFNMSYNFNKHLTATFEAINLLDTPDSRYVDYEMKLPDRYTLNGRQYYVGLRYRF